MDAISMLTRPHSMADLAAGPRLRDILLGLGLGLCGLAAIAIALDIVDPLVRDPDGVIFVLPWLR
jgi:hypothetical protein